MGRIKRILLVDDEASFVELLSKGLTGHGFEVTTAHDGVEAQDKFLACNPDVVLLDIVMPRMDGWGFLKWLRTESKSSVSVIVISGKGDVPDLELGYELRADGYLVKPFAMADVLKAIHTLEEFQAANGIDYRGDIQLSEQKYCIRFIQCPDSHIIKDHVGVDHDIIKKTSKQHKHFFNVNPLNDFCIFRFTGSSQD